MGAMCACGRRQFFPVRDPSESGGRWTLCAVPSPCAPNLFSGVKLGCHACLEGSLGGVCVVPKTAALPAALPTAVLAALLVYNASGAE